MLDLYWSVLTRKSHIDAETNSIILGEIVEEIEFTIQKDYKGKFEELVQKDGYVSLPFQAELVSYLSGDPKKKDAFSIEALLPNGYRVVMLEGKVPNLGENNRTRHRLKMDSLPVSSTGKMEFRLLSGSGNEERILGKLPLFVKLKFAEASKK